MNGDLWPLSYHLWHSKQSGHFKKTPEGGRPGQKKPPQWEHYYIIISKIILCRVQVLVAFNIALENLEIILKIHC